ncbi:ComF family protein [Streptomyces sp. NPDC051051]|uniref:ComF family protein n=1 Tax=Streptomyces sp. NPDC051051 TaxID=3155666 RepID=UPI003426DC72
MESVRRWWQDLSGLVLPAECGGCGTARTVLCHWCRAALHGTMPRRVRPDPEPPGLPAVHAAARYADEVRAVLLAHKERGALALTRPLGTALAGAVRVGLREAGEGEAGEGPPPPLGAVLLVPVPSARRATRSRGHDPARRIALAAAAELRATGAPVRVAAVLRQRRVVADQTGLNSQQRLDNLFGALAVAAGGARLLCGADAVVLVDDLVTTGASLAEAARAVRAALETHRAAESVGPAAADTHRAGPAGRAVGEECVAAVYDSAAREGSGVRPSEARKGGTDPVLVRMPGAARSACLLCAAVVAAPPGAFEINRN